VRSEDDDRDGEPCAEHAEGGNQDVWDVVQLDLDRGQEIRACECDVEGCVEVIAPDIVVFVLSIVEDPELAVEAVLDIRRIGKVGDGECRVEVCAEVEALDVFGDRVVEDPQYAIGIELDIEGGTEIRRRERLIELCREVEAPDILV